MTTKDLNDLFDWRATFPGKDAQEVIALMISVEKERDELKRARNTILEDVLILLAGQGHPTPDATYKNDGGWGLAFSDIKRFIADLRTRLEASEAKEAHLARLFESGRLAMLKERCPSIATDIAIALSKIGGNSVLEELKELRKDKQRLDWLQSGHCVLCLVVHNKEIPCKKLGHVFEIDGFQGAPRHENLRTALDAAKEGV